MEPKLIFVVDYHEFREIEKHLQLVDKKYKCIELGFDGAVYAGLIYHGKKPSKTYIKSLVEKHNIEV